jgi:16S rRNA A1518/A1519 N6-dimethyltransferase RsmA/KsgA/DIM1 with predicted DNA glycosylase/AP lyase activity
VSGAQHFEAYADTYATARPPYPTALWDRVRDLGLLRPGRRALDLGAGSGQATGPLLAAGLKVTGVEPGPRLAAELHAAYPSATVLTARAEDLDALDVLGRHVGDRRLVGGSPPSALWRRRVL